MKFVRLGLALVLAATVAACQKGESSVDAKRLEAAAGNAEALGFDSGEKPDARTLLRGASTHSALTIGERFAAGPVPIIARTFA